jgi:hypothetical protein
MSDASTTVTSVPWFFVLLSVGAFIVLIVVLSKVPETSILSDTSSHSSNITEGSQTPSQKWGSKPLRSKRRTYNPNTEQVREMMRTIHTIPCGTQLTLYEILLYGEAKKCYLNSDYWPDYISKENSHLPFGL